MKTSILKGTTMSDRKKKRIIIIGAGLAGLSCAYKLNELSPEQHQIVILEARDRVGGRVETLRDDFFSDGLYAEAGAFWISENHPLVLYYLQLFGLEQDKFRLVPPNTTLPYYFRNLKRLYALDDSGYAIDMANANEPPIPWPTLTRQDEKLIGFWQLLARYICSLSSLVDPAQPTWPSSQLSADLQACDDMSFLDFLRKRGASEEAIELIRPWFAWWDDLDKVSALSLFRDGAVTRQMCQDPVATWYTIKGGMDRLPRKFQDSLKDKVKLILNAPVTKISQDSHKVAVTYGNSNKDSETMEGDYLVCAIPFSTLRMIDDLPFSQEKLYAIRNLSYATVARVYLQCRQRVWDLEDKHNGVAFLDLPNDLPNDSGICRMNLLDMTYAQKKDTSQGIIQAYMVGMLGERVTNMEEEKRSEFFLRQLTRVYPGIEKSYGSAGKHHTSRCWDKEEWSRGAYPVFRPGQMLELIPHIQSPEGRTFFAGDHTWGRPGWMEGALQSGHRAAKDIIRQAALDQASA
jgi:monoamine oxidase